MTDVDLVPLPGGVFPMGSSLDTIAAAAKAWAPRLLDASWTEDDLRAWLMKEFPRHEVRVSPFAMSRFPVTNAQFRVFAAETGAALPESLIAGEPDDHPVWGLDYQAAIQFCAWLSAGPTVFRLPTEAEWEYAARGPSAREYPYGDEFDPTRCNTVEAGIGATTPVDRYPSGRSEWGIFDLAGNVEEWTSTHYAPYPGGTPVDDHLSALNNGPYLILRGGSFTRGGDLARCARRHGPHPGPEYRHRGFRVVGMT